MADISNKFLVFLLVIAILVTIIGVYYSIDRINRFSAITGYGTTPTGTGNVTFGVGNITAINITQPTCDFKTGYVTPPYAYAILHPGASGSGSPGPYCDDTSDTKANWTNTTGPYDPDCIAIRNDGTTCMKVNVSSGLDASGFIGGTNPEYKVWSENKETDACTSDLISFANREEMDTTNKTICSLFRYEIDNDEMYAGCYLKVPDDATVGSHTDTWTFYGIYATCTGD